MISRHSETEAPARPGQQLLRELMRSGYFIFTTEEARTVSDGLGIHRSALNPLLFQLCKGGWLVRLRRGLYAGTGQLPGMSRIPSFAIATRLVTPSAISHLSAMHHHGFTDQIPLGVTAMTPRKVLTPTMRHRPAGKESGRHAWIVGGIRYEYVGVAPARYFGITEVWVDEHFKVPITDRERTVLDGVARPRLVGGMGEMLGVLEEHLHTLNLDRLAAYAGQYGLASVAKRLGWALEQAGAPADALAPLLAVPAAGYRLLDPGRPPRGRCDKRWGLQINVETGRGIAPKGGS